MKKLLLSSVILSSILLPLLPANAACVYPDDLDSRGRRCGGRASSVRPGGYEPPVRYQNTYQQPSYFGPTGLLVNQWVILKTDDPQSRVNLRSRASLYAPVVARGNPGDRVWASIRELDSYGYYWYKVGYEGTSIVGWVREDLIAR